MILVSQVRNDRSPWVTWSPGSRPLRIETAVSLPLDMVSVLSLLYRAVPGSDLDPWLVDARRRLPDPVRADLDLLHGFSGRLLYYPEEPVMRFEPLRPDRLDASFDDLLAFMAGIPADEYRDMVGHALQRVYADLEMRWRPPADEESWPRALAPALTTHAPCRCPGPHRRSRAVEAADHCPVRGRLAGGLRGGPRGRAADAA